MKPGSLIAILVLAGLCIAGAFLIFGGGNPQVTTPAPTPPSKLDIVPAKTAAKSDDCPPLPKEGAPTSKIVFDEQVFSFGVMESFQQKSHVFTVRNEGQADLLIKQGHVSCKCTISKAAEEPIPPGKSAEITLTWKPIQRGEDWSQTAEICTNDPKNRKVTFTIKGDVVERLSLIPTEAWQLGEVVENKLAHVYGRIYSMSLDKFQILEVSSPDTKLLKTSWQPMTPEELKTYKAKSGYLVRVEALAGQPAGTFTYSVDIRTDVPEEREDGTSGPPVTKKIQISGMRDAPFKFMPDDGWYEEKQVLALEEVPTLKATRRTVQMFVRDCPPEGLKILEQKCLRCEKKPITLSIEPDTKYEGKARRYFVHLDFTAGPDLNPRVDTGHVGCRIRMKTNHPEAKDFELKVFYLPL